MRMRLLCLLALPALAFSFPGWAGLANQAGGNATDKAAIQKQGAAFVEAFHKGDAKAVAAFWVPDGDYIDQTGLELKGRAAIEKALAGMFADNKGMKVRIDGNSLRFVTPDVAVEDGTTEVFPAGGGPPSKARYTNILVKKDGTWLLSSVRESAFVPPGNFRHLSGLAWAIGEWAGEADHGGTERLAVVWTDNQNFIKAKFSTTVKKALVGSATQRIGWDPEGKRIRSWVFDESGGFGEGSWTQDGKKWVAKTTHVLQDGTKMTATYILTSVDPDTITLQAKDRIEGGNKLPDTKEVKLKRVK
jgi:uncharacterized protein (TIGR02246 family)